jgi:hypothetical protein
MSDGRRRRSIRLEITMTTESISDEAATELHNRLASQIVQQILHEPIAAGGSMSDIMLLCESALLGVVLGCFELGSDVKAFDLIVGRVKERLAEIRLEDIKAKGHG